MRKALLILPLFFIVVASAWFYKNALKSSEYNGLVTVPCIDETETVYTYNVYIEIDIDEKKYPLDKTIGHDPGKCLRVIHTNDSSGKVIVSENDNTGYTLENFFEVWHKTFNDHQIFDKEIVDGHNMQVFVDGKLVKDYEHILLKKDDIIKIVYK